MTRAFTALAAGLVPVLAACGAGDRPAAGHTVVDSAGVRIVESVAPEWGENGRAIEPQPFLRIGQVDGEPALQFGYIASAVLLRDGGIAVADAQAGEVRVFDAEGRHVRTIGRQGEGPGEFRAPMLVLEYPGDSLAVYDARLRRTTIFARGSGEPRTVANQVEGNSRVFGSLGTGSFLLFNPGERRRDGRQGLQWDSSDIVAVRADGSPPAVVARLPVRERVIAPDGGSAPLAPFGIAVQAAADDGFYWGTSDRYEIRFYDADGRVRRIIRRPVEPEPVTDAMIEAYEAGLLDWVRRREGEAAVPSYRQSFRQGTFGERVPLFGTAFVDRDGRLWVSESPWPVYIGLPRRWSIFSPDGVWLGDVGAPDRVRLVDARGDVVLGIGQDELDVQYVQLHRLTGG